MGGGASTAVEAEEDPVLIVRLESAERDEPFLVAGVEAAVRDKTVRWPGRKNARTRHAWHQCRALPRGTELLLRWHSSSSSVAAETTLLLQTAEQTRRVVLFDDVAVSLSARVGSARGKKRLFFVRHAESLWNAGPLSVVARTDHALSREGVSQAKALAARLTETPKTELERSFLASETNVWSSPLRRAVQTSLLALSQHPAARRDGVTLLSSLREVRCTAASRDNVASAVGDAIRAQALQDLDLQDACAVHAGDAADDWWSTGTEDATAVKRRVADFLDHLRLGDATSTIVVGHSYFLRALLRAHASPDAGCDHLRNRKLPNCAVLALDLDFSRADHVVVHLEDGLFLSTTTFGVGVGVGASDPRSRSLAFSDDDAPPPPSKKKNSIPS